VIDYLNEAQNLPIDQYIIMLIFSMAKDKENDQDIHFYDFKQLLYEKIYQENSSEDYNSNDEDAENLSRIQKINI